MRKRILEMIMAIRGLDKKKHLKEWQEPKLSVMSKKMKMQGKSQNWRKAVEKGQEDAFVIMFLNGKRTYLQELISTGLLK